MPCCSTKSDAQGESAIKCLAFFFFLFSCDSQLLTVELQAHEAGTLKHAADTNLEEVREQLREAMRQAALGQEQAAMWEAQAAAARCQAGDALAHAERVAAQHTHETALLSVRIK